MAMALAVAMVACQAATPKPAEKGDPGEQGEAGPAGPPGTTDNEPPMATMDLPMVYLALKGTGAMPMKEGIDLGKHFMDAENAALTYKAETSDKAIAKYKIEAGKLTVTGEGAGTATITVKAYDGVNTDPAMNSFEVMVVASNAKPVAMLTGDASTDANPSELTITADTVTGEQEQLRSKLYRANVRGKTTISATIHAGNDPFPDEVSFSYDMGADGKDDDIVDVEITPKSGAVNMWEVKLTPMKAGMQNVYVTVKDKFGATAETPGPGDGDGNGTVEEGEHIHQGFQFVAFVNTVPKLDMALANKTLVSGNTHDYLIADHFDTGETPVIAGPKIGKMEKPAEAPAVTADTPAPAADVAEGGVIDATQRANDAACSATSSDMDVASVIHASDDEGTAITVAATSGVPTFDELKETVAIRVTGGDPGKAIITITCRDNEGSATGTATVTVRAAR